jgi:hypothetical protein
MNLLKLQDEMEAGKKFFLRVSAWHQFVFPHEQGETSLGSK